jgi:hypothetical protein
MIELHNVNIRAGCHPAVILARNMDAESSRLQENGDTA